MLCIKWLYLCHIYCAPTPELTSPPTSLAANFERCEMLDLAQENARARGSG